MGHAWKPKTCPGCGNVYRGRRCKSPECGGVAERKTRASSPKRRTVPALIRFFRELAACGDRHTNAAGETMGIIVPERLIDEARATLARIEAA